ncbi:MAG: hypothetical protein QMB92_07830 [Thiopseudomonas sp.]
MYSESVVYGCIRDWPIQDYDQQQARALHNRQVLECLPAAETWSVLARDMFSCRQPHDQLTPTSQVIHFAASYRSIEYEWDTWVRQFEALLKRLYWSTAVVHLEAESHGSHRFSWQSESFELLTLEEQLRMRCTWERESGLSL